MEPFLLIIPVILIVALISRMAAGGMDHDRIKEYVASNGGRVLDSNWSPLGPGWFGEKSDRIYSVRYVDRHGNEHDAFCKTSMWTGVYFTEDRIVKHAEVTETEAQTESELRAENRRLREEVRRLRSRLDDD